MATILAHITVREGTEQQFEGIAATLHRASFATETRMRAYGYWRGAEPRSYYTLLAFDDFHGFLEHQTSDHHEGASPELRECIETIRLEWVDPIQGASTLPPTNPQDIPDDADTLTRRYAQFYAPDIAEWWLPLR